MRNTRLRAGETEVILMAKGTVKLAEVTIVDRDKGILEESTEVIAIPPNLAR